ncbi:uncharacterized protein BT62DRAFT_933806 [Guyanagaster necrorhizus]|uniref:Uncharacterized protein n=1 Tax=Guyanagaster necrorhizus TaxID=856835 RepID=A0A9P8ARC9_9AGAR|nr:uncharacterized protein BT62DRAFT_933806 [Guyanagaster necrorhizus MCA 3950]KAG7444756.1 hypothetical protein BT62DRAFT_933806 [Guyanagaster necrorhizus MCA 3950]
MSLGPTELRLHSPSEIIGTPFDIESPRFEYPFPEPSSSPAEPLNCLASAASSISSLQSPLNHITAIHLPQPDIPSFVPVRTKVRTETIPIPPGLVEKRHRWSLIERRVSEDSTNLNKGDVQFGRGSAESERQGRRSSSAGRENNTNVSR